jgi:hypothetical protein
MTLECIFLPGHVFNKLGHAFLDNRWTPRVTGMHFLIVGKHISASGGHFNT